MMSKDRADSTKYGYKCLTVHFVEFIKQHQPDLVSAGADSDDVLNLGAVSMDHLKAFFDHVSIKRQNVKCDRVFSEPVPKVNEKH
eukprot:1200886-Rhodomonas_salina.1